VSGAPEAGFGDGAPHGPLAGLHVLVVPSYWPSPESPTAGIFFVSYVRAFAAAGAQVGVVYADLIEPHYLLRRPVLPVVPQLKEEVLDGVPVVRVRGLHTSLRRPHRRTLRFAAWLRRGYARYVERHGRPDLIQAHCAVPAGWPAVVLGSAPVLITEHTGPFSLALATPAMERLTREALAAARAIVAVSPNLRQQMLEAGIGRPIEVIPNPVAAEFAYAPPPEVRRAPAGRPLYQAIFIGRMVREKGVHELIEAAHRLAAEGEVDLHWHLVDQGPERAALIAGLSEASGADGVIWHGLIPRQQVARLVRESHFLVLPSYGENCPLSVEEALSVGRPVVGTLGTGTAALVGPDDGILCQPRDAAGLAAAIAALLRDYGRWDARAIATGAQARFAPAAVAARYAPLLRSATGAPGG